MNIDSGLTWYGIRGSNGKYLLVGLILVSLCNCRE